MTAFRVFLYFVAIVGGYVIGSIISETARLWRERTGETVWTGIAEQFSTEYISGDSKATFTRFNNRRAWRRHHPESL